MSEDLFSNASAPVVRRSDASVDHLVQGRLAATLTDILTADLVVIYDEHDSQTVRQRGRGKEIKRQAVAQLLTSGNYSEPQAERVVEQRLVTLIKLGRIIIER